MSGRSVVAQALRTFPDGYSRSIRYLEEEEERLWSGVEALEDGDNSAGARMLRSQHARAIREIMLEHSRRVRDVVEREVVAPPAPAPELREYRVYSNRKTPGRTTTLEALLLPSLGYGTELAAEAWAARFRKCNPGLKAEVR